jgi:hypothetical protein
MIISMDFATNNTRPAFLTGDVGENRTDRHASSGTKLARDIAFSLCLIALLAHPPRDTYWDLCIEIIPRLLPAMDFNFI